MPCAVDSSFTITSMMFLKYNFEAFTKNCSINEYQVPAKMKREDYRPVWFDCHEYNTLGL